MSDVIDSFKDQYKFLSNFYPVEVYFENHFYSSVEHAYQAAKTLVADEREIIRLIENPGMAKKMSKHVTLRPGWDDMKLEIMGELVYQKFYLYPKLGKMLKETGNRPIVEGNWWGDTYWGICRGKGQNNLGKLLMAVRQTLLEK